MGYAKGHQTKQVIYDATIQLLKEKGYTKTTVRDIAHLSGENSALIYYYFPEGKFEIARNLLQVYRDRILQYLSSYSTQTHNPVFMRLLTNAFMFRELQYNPKDYSFFIDVWGTGKLHNSIYKQQLTAYIRNNGISNDESMIDRFLCIMDGIFSDLHMASNKGCLKLSEREILHAAETCGWMYFGFNLKEIEQLIEITDNLAERIPHSDIEIFPDTQNLTDNSPAGS